jgi:osmotically-inducible protein OsmY
MLLLICCMPWVTCPPAGAATSQAERPSEARSADEWITIQIQAKYFLDPDIKQRTIDISTINGVVTLAGRVASDNERTRAAEIASRIAGVRDVNNRLITGGPDAAAPTGTSGKGDPPSGTPVPGSGTIERVTHSDLVILSQIKAKYAVDPDVSALGIDVDVERGVVTLTGDVDSQATRLRAETLALAVPGVTRVKNELKLKR